MATEPATTEHKELLEAISDRDVRRVQDMLEDGVSPDAAVDGITALFEAADRGRSDIVEILLKAGARPNRRMRGETDGVGAYRTALNAAAACGDITSVELLLAAGADPTSTDDQMRTAGHLLTDATRFAQGVRYKGMGEEWIRGTCNVLGAMLDRGLKVNQQDGTGKTMLHNVVLERAPAMLVDMLFARGADPTSLDHSGFAPLHYACLGDRARYFEMFTQHGVDLDVRTRDGRYPLHICDAEQTFELLMDRRPDLELRDHEGRTALANQLNYWGCGPWTGKAARLVSAGANLDTPDFDGVTPRDIIKREKIVEVAAAVAALEAREAMARVFATRSSSLLDGPGG
jgi:ankyrin repeat protein